MSSIRRLDKTALRGLQSFWEPIGLPTTGPLPKGRAPERSDLVDASTRSALGSLRLRLRLELRSGSFAPMGALTPDAASPLAPAQGLRRARLRLAGWSIREGFRRVASLCAGRIDLRYALHRSAALHSALRHFAILGRCDRFALSRLYFDPHYLPALSPR